MRHRHGKVLGLGLLIGTVLCMVPLAAPTDVWFTARRDFNVSVGRLPGAVAVADFDGDGRPDLATAHWDSFHVSVLRGRGDGTFAPPQSFPAGPQSKVWRSTNQGNNWTPIGSFPNSWGLCNDQSLPIGEQERECTSLISIAVHPTPPSYTVYVATFGHENYPPSTPPTTAELNLGQGRGVLRNTDPSNPNSTWQEINSGLCPNGNPGPNCTGVPLAQSLSLFVGTVVTSPAGNVYIATLNGLYKWNENTTRWDSINGNIPADTRRFESIAVDPNNENILYAGTSEVGNGTTQPPPARIFKGEFIANNWSWTSMTFPDSQNPMGPLAWSDRYRVRDIQVKNGTTPGQPKAYAVIEGSGIYVHNQP